jgi:2-succinyl-5-enolpyruvyl-6-hydroxy-3-cyclohexene-1-carboxylate synthase
MTSASLRVQVVVDLLKKHNIKNIVFSPGSRNAPLVIGFNSDDYFNTKVLVDERSAAFFALGMAQQLKKPVAICSTSGSAVVNYSPAIVEAYYQKIPIIVITADRPPEWIDHGEGQSMRQENVYENFIGGSFNLPMLDHPDALWQTGVMTNEAIHVSQIESKPVHINFPFREPLYDTVNKSIVNTRKISHLKVNKSLESNHLKELQNIWGNSSKKMIICGTLEKSNQLNKLLSDLNNNDSLCILNESTSNLHNENFICCIDRTLERVYGKIEFIPELVITIGNSIISKKLKQLLRKNKPSNHWHIEDTNRAQDIFSSITHFIPLKPVEFFSQFIENISVKNKSKFGKMWEKEFHLSEKFHRDFLKSCDWSDLKAHDVIQDCIRNVKINIQMGNSSSVRYIQLFSNLKAVSYNSNRGVSGIDGSCSTAVGAANCTNNTTLLVTGDLSFIYDQNSLWNDSLPPNLKIVVVNNQGGGIFNIIPGPKTTPYAKKHFETSHNLSLEKIAATYKINYQCANNETKAIEYINKIMKSNQMEILEFFTADSKNEKILNQYFKEIKK